MDEQQKERLKRGLKTQAVVWFLYVPKGIINNFLLSIILLIIGVAAGYYSMQSISAILRVLILLGIYIVGRFVHYIGGVWAGKASPESKKIGEVTINSYGPAMKRVGARDILEAFLLGNILGIISSFLHSHF